MTTNRLEPLDPLIHVPARLRILVTLAALNEGDTLSFTRLQNMLDLTPGNLITHLRKLEDARYLTSEKTVGWERAGDHSDPDNTRSRRAGRVHRGAAQSARRAGTVSACAGGYG